MNKSLWINKPLKINGFMSSNFFLDKGRMAENLQTESLLYFIISSTSLWRNHFNHIRKNIIKLVEAKNHLTKWFNN